MNFLVKPTREIMNGSLVICKDRLSQYINNSCYIFHVNDVKWNLMHSLQIFKKSHWFTRLGWLKLSNKYSPDRTHLVPGLERENVWSDPTTARLVSHLQLSLKLPARIFAGARDERDLSSPASNHPPAGSLETSQCSWLASTCHHHREISAVEPSSVRSLSVLLISGRTASLLKC